MLVKNDSRRMNWLLRAYLVDLKDFLAIVLSFKDLERKLTTKNLNKLMILMLSIQVSSKLNLMLKILKDNLIIIKR